MTESSPHATPASADASGWEPPAARGPLQPALLRRVLRITLLYAGFATAWILFSDHAVGLIARSGNEVVQYSLWKGVAFVAVTALVLFTLMATIFGRLDAAYRLLVRHEEEIARFNRLYTALSEVNQACLWTTSREALFQQVCQAFVQSGGLKLAWIAQPSKPPGRLVPLTAHGDDAGYLERIDISTEETPEGRRATTMAWRKGRPVVKNHLLSDPESVPWRNIFREHGYAACAAIPIREGDEVGAVLTVYSQEPGFFQDREVDLVKRAANNLAYALDNLRREQRRSAAEAQVHAERQLSQAMLESMPGIIFLYDQQGKMLRWNRNLETVSRYTSAEIARMHPHDFFLEEGRGRVDAAIAALLAGGADSNLEARLKSNDGTVTHYQVISRRIEIDGEPCVLGQAVEIVVDRVQVEALPGEAQAVARA